MRIALVSAMGEITGPDLHYGGIERVVNYLDEGLVARGHDVTLFAAKGSTSANGKLVALDASIRDSGADPVECCRVSFALLHAAYAGVRRGEFDLVHNHNNAFGFAHSFRNYAPTLITLHWDLLGSPIRPQHYRVPANSISLSQRTRLPGLNYIANIYHGLPRDQYRFAAERGKYLVFLGRLDKDKGPHHAIKIARAAGMPLKIAGKIGPESAAWVEHEVAPHIDGKRVQYIGEIDDAGKQELLGNACALLFPIGVDGGWFEPLGLVCLEALACGTPVIAFDAGAPREIIKDGVTGYVCGSIQEMIKATRTIGRIERAACRRDFEQRWTVDRMLNDYEAVYARLMHEDAAMMHEQRKTLGAQP